MNLRERVFEVRDGENVASAGRRRERQHRLGDGVRVPLVRSVARRCRRDTQSDELIE